MVEQIAYEVEGWGVGELVFADGLGSYGSLGPDYKRRLLELEGVVL